MNFKNDLKKLLDCDNKKLLLDAVPSSFAGGALGQVLLDLIRGRDYSSLFDLLFMGFIGVMTMSLSVLTWRIGKQIWGWDEEKPAAPSPDEFVTPPISMRREYLEALQKLSNEVPGCNGNLAGFMAWSLDNSVVVRALSERFDVVAMRRDDSGNSASHEEIVSTIRELVPEIFYRNHPLFKEAPDANGGGTPSAAEGAA